MARINKCVPITKDCYSAALERVEYLYDTFDQVWVSFSGGKDSSVCLNLAIQVATAKKKLPVNVYTFDEEAIPPETVEYMQRVADRDDVNFLWYCVPLEHRNACSTKEPYWYTWEPEKKHLWVRDLPPTAITTPLIKKRGGIPEQCFNIFDIHKGTVANIMGIRSQESLTRLRAIAVKSGDKAFMAPGAGFKWIRNGYPIYDWKTEDVWLGHELSNWDYNHAYDVMTLAGIPISLQRCCPPFGEQPLRGLHQFKTCWPELWSKMVNRVHGAATAARYANTSLYGTGVKDKDLPEGMTWRDLVFQTISKLTPVSKKEVADAIKVCLNIHRGRSDNPMPDAEPDSGSGFCWKTLYIAAKVGGNKFARQSQKMSNKALAERVKNEGLGISTDKLRGMGQK